MTETIDNLKNRMMRDTPPNEIIIRGTCRSCGWSERIVGRIGPDGYCQKCYEAHKAEADREFRAIISRRRD